MNPPAMETTAVYFEALKDRDLHIIQFAAEVAILECTRFPTVKQLIDFSRGYKKPVQQDLRTPAIEYTPHDIAAKKWEEIIRAFETGDFSGLELEEDASKNL